MKTAVTLTTTVAVLMLSVAVQADPWKDESGRGRGGAKEFWKQQEKFAERQRNAEERYREEQLKQAERLREEQQKQAERYREQLSDRRDREHDFGHDGDGYFGPYAPGYAPSGAVYPRRSAYPGYAPEYFGTYGGGVYGGDYQRPFYDQRGYGYADPSPYTHSPLPMDYRYGEGSIQSPYGDFQFQWQAR